jgi:hypothetical protein
MCAEVKHTTRRKWVRLVGLGYDLQLWSPDERQPAHGCKRQYSNCNIKWLQDIIEPWRSMIFPGLDLYLATEDVANSEVAILFGISQSIVYFFFFLLVV